MPRLRLTLPEKLPFATELPVRITDLNYGRHVGNDAVLGLLHEARCRFLASHGWREDDVAGCGMIMADAAIVYRAQMFHGDTLRIEVGVSEVRRTGFELAYRITRLPAGELAVEAATGMAFFDYAAKRIVRTPAAFAERCAAAAPG